MVPGSAEGAPVTRAEPETPSPALPEIAAGADAAASSSSRPPTPEPPTREMTAVGAEAAPPAESVEPSVPEPPVTPVSAGVVRRPDRTMRSEPSPEGDAPPRAAGYVVPPTPPLPARPAGASPGSHTVPAGTEPQAPDSLLGRPGAGPLPGESIPVVAPPRQSTLPGVEANVGLLVLVGVVFAALGVGLTLWYMLVVVPSGAVVHTAATASAEPEPLTPFPGVAQHPRGTSQPHGSAQPHGRGRGK